MGPWILATAIEAACHSTWKTTLLVTSDKKLDITWI